MCSGLGVVDSMDVEGEVWDCPRCALVNAYGRAYEVVRRDVTPVAGPGERVASPAVLSQCNVFEVYELRPKEGLGRCVFSSPDIGEAHRFKWDLEEQTYGISGIEP